MYPEDSHIAAENARRPWGITARSCEIPDNDRTYENRQTVEVLPLPICSAPTAKTAALYRNVMIRTAKIYA